MNHTKEPWDDPKCVERFWSKVEVAGKDDCWIWQRGTSGFGYGNFHYGKMSIRAHRFSYQLHNGRIGGHNCVCHSCDNPKCVNPAHLWIGTRAENNADKEAKQRGIHPNQSSGEGNSNAAITTPEVIAIKVMARKGMPQSRIAAFIGVSPALVCLIVKGERRQEESEQRVSACVNACAGIETHELELMTGRMSIASQIKACDAIYATAEAKATRRSKFARQRDELLAAIEQTLDENGHLADGENCTLIVLKKALAKAKGGT